MNDWPVFYKDELKIGNLKSSFGICTLWTKKEIIYSKIPEEKYAACGNLYTVQGINPMLKNILANPGIRKIILCGADLTKSGEALINFIRHGIDENRKIVGSSGFIDDNIPDGLIEKLRSNIEILDLRGKENEIIEALKDEEPAPFMEPVIISEVDTIIAETCTEETAFRVSGKTIAGAWLKMLDIVMKFGGKKSTEYNMMQKEILNLTAVVEDDGGLGEWLPITEEDLENYYSNFFGKAEDFGVTYTYGERLYSYPLQAGNRFNQIDYAVSYLRKNRDTRRAIAFVWNVELDSFIGNEPPCITQISWSVKNGKLYQTAIIRSNDIFRAWPINAFGLRKIQKEVSEKACLEPGPLTTVSISAHVYENNWKEAERILGRFYRNRQMLLEEDRNGYFVIRIEDGEIAVEHRVPDGRKSPYEFRGKKAQVLYKQILNENLASRIDHAAYLGYELARAEAALKEGKQFVQDQA
ncbi:MAG: DUF4346 domain-containing protein [Candidatus Aenigmarchaeota archaeon]|nr:DUF4346 domain-containing protein [Candidatus Aenigmarchaeota archaeon]